MRILLLDIETAPNTAHVWGLWNENIPLDRLVTSGYTLSWAAKWHGEDQVVGASLGNTGPKTMLKAIHKMMNEADVIVHYNGTKFDIPTLNKEFVQYGMGPPAPYKQIDLLRTCRNQFRFPSNKLAYVVKALGLGEKAETGGYDTWLGCMAGDKEAFRKMEAYNVHDVILLEKLYDKLRPWIKGHANQNLYGESCVCPVCASSNYQRRGYAVVSTLRYRRYRCNECSSWFRSFKSDGPKPEEKFIGA